METLNNAVGEERVSGKEFAERNWDYTELLTGLFPSLLL